MAEARYRPDCARPHRCDLDRVAARMKFSCRRSGAADAPNNLAALDRARPRFRCGDPRSETIEHAVLRLVVADRELLGGLQDHRIDLVRLDLVLGERDVECLFVCGHHDFSHGYGHGHGSILRHSAAAAVTDGKSATERPMRVCRARATGHRDAWNESLAAVTHGRECSAGQTHQIMRSDIRFALERGLLLETVIAGEPTHERPALPVLQDTADVLPGDAGHRREVALADSLADQHAARADVLAKRFREAKQRPRDPALERE